MRRVIFLALTYVLIPLSRGYGQAIVSPGIKLSVLLGEKPSWSYGIEVSYSVLREYNRGIIPVLSYGVVADIDLFRENIRFHLGAEAAYLAGLESGVTMVVASQDVLWGWRSSLYIPTLPFANSHIVIYPYFGYSTLTKGPDIYEIGSFFKVYPFKVSFDE